MWAVCKVISQMEIVGEVVADLIGLNESRFQYVLDSMSEEDMLKALQVQREREEEDRVYNESLAGNGLESGVPIVAGKI